MSSKKTKILMLVPFLPNTTTSGGQTRWYNIIKYMSESYDITLFSLIKDESEKRFIPELERYCKKVRVFTRPKSPWAIRNLLLTAFSYYPLLVVRNWSFSQKRAVAEELASEKYDLIHAETFYVMPHISKTNVPTILVEQTIEYQVYKHYVDTKVPRLLRPLFLIDIVKLRFWEKYFWKKTDQLVAVSKEDKKVMQDLVPGISVDIIPNGVDASYYAAKKADRIKPPRVLYGVTNFEWLQNLEAVDILLSEVWPLVKKRFPSARVWLAGRMIPQRIKEMARKRDDLEMIEFVKDARDVYRKASVMVTPIKGAGGTRLKILEAMAASLPVVSTSVGVAGLGLIDGRHAIVADTPGKLAAGTVKLLKNPKKAEEIGRSGREFVSKNYDWRVIVKLHDKIYAKILK